MNGANKHLFISINKHKTVKFRQSTGGLPILFDFLYNLVVFFAEEINNIKMDQPTELQKQALLTKILNSPEFHDSKRYQELLQYLVEKSIKATSLKETEIAHDVFGKDSKFDPGTDPLIRSYISNLRKKLEHYYLTTTDQLEFKLEIPKGHYLVKYTPIDKIEVIPQKVDYKKYLYPVIVFVLVCIIIVMQLGRQSVTAYTDNPSANDPIWKEFLNKKSLPTLIVIGDYLLLSEKGNSLGRTFTRVPQINSEKELRNYIKMDPKKYGGLEISEVTYIGAGASLGVTYLMQTFSGMLQKFSVKLSHELKWDDFESHNIIYIGTFKTLDKLDTLFSRTNIRYHLQPNSLSIISGKARDTLMSFKLNWYGGNYQKDYSVILKILSTKSNSIMFLTGFSEVGVMDAVKSVIDPNFVSRLNKFSGEKDFSTLSHFEVISEVEGLRYTIFGSQIKYVQIF